MVSEKQKAILTKNGYTSEAINKMSYDEVSKAIGAILQGATPAEGKATYEKPQFTPKAKPSYDPTSQYVSYAKDLCVAMMQLEKGHEKVEVDKLMDLAIILVGAARDRLK